METCSIKNGGRDGMDKIECKSYKKLSKAKQRQRPEFPPVSKLNVKVIGKEKF